MEVKTFMKTDVVTIQAGSTLEEVISLLVEKRIGTLPVVDGNMKLQGVISIIDVLSLFLPDFFTFVENVDFIKDYGALELTHETVTDFSHSTKVDAVMNKKPVTVQETCSLLRAISLMKKHNLIDLLVVKDDKVTGLVSYVDLGRGFLVLLKQENN